MSGTRKIKIEGVPPGEAPFQIREAWVGLVLPIVGRRSYRMWTSGVLTGARTPWGRLWSALRGRWRKREGYAVDAAEAIRLLAIERPDAAQWWRENAPHLIGAHRRFLFERTVCQLIDSSI
jgi:hypothetical protein